MVPLYLIDGQFMITLVCLVLMTFTGIINLTK